MRRIATIALTLAFMLAMPVAAFATSGHFITGGANAPECVVVDDTTVQCTGKVAGLGGTTFEITVEAEGTAEVQCRNRGGNVAPGQDTQIVVEGTTDPQPTPRNGNYNFDITTDDPEPLPATPTCPNRHWTPEIVSIDFGDATLTLWEDGVVSDQVTVPVN